MKRIILIWVLIGIFIGGLIGAFIEQDKCYDKLHLKDEEYSKQISEQLKTYCAWNEVFKEPTRLRFQFEKKGEFRSQVLTSDCWQELAKKTGITHNTESRCFIEDVTVQTGYTSVGCNCWYVLK